jgi:hypothetical protein
MSSKEPREGPSMQRPVFFHALRALHSDGRNSHLQCSLRFHVKSEGGLHRTTNVHGAVAVWFLVYGLPSSIMCMPD